ncbi:MAG: DciA family protein [candidate division WOR-3 bacterium]
MKRVSDALLGVLKHLKAEGVLNSIRIIKVAKRVLKPYECDVLSYDRGILFVWTAKPERRFEIQAKKTEIVGVINAFLGENVVKDIKFRKK